MAELVLTNVDEVVFRNLRERAARHGRTPDQEAKAILAESVGAERLGTWTAVDAIYGRLAASGRSFGHSAELLREDRNR